MPCLLAVDLVKDAKPASVIVIPAQPTKVVKYAADELQYHIRKATGAILPIESEDALSTAEGSRIYLGPCRETLKAGLNPDDIAPNAFKIRSVGKDLFLVGKDNAVDPVVPWVVCVGEIEHMGTLFAVYELLKEKMGVRWLWPGEAGEVIPLRDSLVLDNYETDWTPPLIHARARTHPGATQRDGWTSEQSMREYGEAQTVFLRRHRWARSVSLEYPHGFTTYWDRFGKTHPEYFAQLPDGTRRPDPTYENAGSVISMCVSQPSLWKQAIEDWKGDRTAQLPWINACENDTAGKCTCEGCLAWDAPDVDSKVPFNDRVAEAGKIFDKAEGTWYKPLGSLSDRYAKFCLALQKEAEKENPKAVVYGLSYWNYVDAPLQTKLNERIIISFTPEPRIPFTQEEEEKMNRNWDAWADTGARLVYRPNYFLYGHNLPVFFADQFGDHFSRLFNRKMIATDFDALTGQWGTQGPNLYVLARMQTDANVPVGEILDEYYSGFGPAKKEIQAYFDYWKKISPAMSKNYTGFNKYYIGAARVFTPEVMNEGFAILDRARDAAGDDGEAVRRVEFLQKGLKNASLTMDTQRAYEEFVKNRGNPSRMAKYISVLRELDALRASTESDYLCNVGYLTWAEAYTWDRSILTQGGKLQPLSWRFQWDPQNKGISEKWFADGVDERSWSEINTDGPWHQQDVGKRWREEHGEDYLGSAWYRSNFEVDGKKEGKSYFLVFGAVDKDCTVWVNGEQVLYRPYPYQGDGESWMKMFEVDITAALRAGEENTVAVRVESKVAQGGIWKPVYVTEREGI